ncbi:hypothetical protein BT96DRAFT_923640 [Gymnopus androsaceus JB14]|uniref:Uncharacterized protein n=1 Tax=Gymnopus androsaceus JB14 TaxID=1447944 RepID=A0A6A4H7U1_9AGAR|nr:hypothetical protein BT96DRAFT_923640 [Gymnopus androsaceus JB14]
MSFGNGISSFKFYVLSLPLSPISSLIIYFPKTDGAPASIDGFRDSGPLLCTTLFSQEGLDNSTEHEISVLVAGFSPSANETVQNEEATFWPLLLLFHQFTTSNAVGNISAAPIVIWNPVNVFNRYQHNGASSYSMSPIPFAFLSLLPVYIAASIVWVGGFELYA